jgi:beta-lactamase superfamily II metal-dependent hydrolase
MAGPYAPSAGATPPDYATFHREQKENYDPEPDDLMRIWMVYVGQGDGLLIQLPPKNSYDPDPEDEDPSRTERVDILIDGGSSLNSNVGRMESFLTRLYEDPTVEHAVITHHDSDHVKGLIYMLEQDSVAVESIYHNGLASYARGKRGFSNGTSGSIAVIDKRSGQLRKGMAFLEDDGERMKPGYLIEDLAALEQGLEDEDFQGTYADLAGAVVNETAPIEVTAFGRCREGGSFIEEREADMDRGVDLTGISLELLSPMDPPRKYGGWGETINGNSVTFRLEYKNFDMLFTGDHNEKSEEALLEHLEQAGKLDLLSCDVLKVPHHGSSHAYKDFLGRNGCNPVVSIASMGEHGFKSKQMYSGAWQHPSTDVISWLGRSHRVYHTLIHEKRFRWSDLKTTDDHEAMHEYSHILVETDGEWFRVVEIDIDIVDLDSPPSVHMTRRGNGTRWIKAD